MHTLPAKSLQLTPAENQLLWCWVFVRVWGVFLGGGMVGFFLFPPAVGGILARMPD